MRRFAAHAFEAYIRLDASRDCRDAFNSYYRPPSARFSTTFIYHDFVLPGETYFAIIISVSRASELAYAYTAFRIKRDFRHSSRQQARRRRAKGLVNILTPPTLPDFSH